MDVAPVTHGLRVKAFDRATPSGCWPMARKRRSRILVSGLRPSRERERGLDAIEDHLHAGTFSVSLGPDEALTLYFRPSRRPRSTASKRGSGGRNTKRG